jgi:hypothetical protein
LLFDGGAMKRIGTPLQGPGLLPLHDATCLAFWCSDEERLAELERCAASIAGGKELQVPRAPCKLHCLLRGVSDGCSVFVQALTHRPKDCALRDVLWRDGWRAIRLAAMGHRAAWEIAERHPAFWCAPAKGRAWPQGCGLRPLSSDEREDLLQAVRWGW